MFILYESQSYELLFLTEEELDLAMKIKDKFCLVFQSSDFLIQSTFYILRFRNRNRLR